MESAPRWPDLKSALANKTAPFRPEATTSLNETSAASQMQRPLKVLVDARKLADGGIGAYTESLIEGLLSDPRVELTAITRQENSFPTHWQGRVTQIIDNAREYSFDELLMIPRRINMRNFDVLHVPHYTLPFSVPIPSVVTIHDLIQLRFANRFYHPFIARQLIRSAVRRASAVVTVSQAVAKDIKKEFNLTESTAARISVIPNAARPSVSISSDDRRNILKDRGLLEPFFLAVTSTPKRHKGLPDLLRSYRGMVTLVAGFDSRRSVPPLVCVGQGITELCQNPEVRELLRLLGNQVKILGEISRAELDVLYGAARAVIIPSLDEGFCLPMLEAHVHGTPVVARPVPALKELALPGDILATDFSVEALGRALVSSVRDVEGLARIQLARGLQGGAVLRKYSRQATSAQLLAVYASVSAYRPLSLPVNEISQSRYDIPRQASSGGK